MELLLEMYVRGNNEAKAYAMVAFYYMAPSLYDKLLELHKKKKTLVSCQSGCLRSRRSFAKLHNWIQMGHYGQGIPAKLRVREDMIQRNLPKGEAMGTADDRPTQRPADSSSDGEGREGRLGTGGRGSQW